MTDFCLAFKSFFGFCFLAFLIFWENYSCETWSKQRRKEDKIYKISYKTFLSLYFICPNKWNIKPKEYMKNYILYESFKENVEQYFYFGFVDYYRFRLFFKKQSKAEKNYIETERMAKVLKSFRKDIEDYDKENIKSLKKELENIAEEREKF